MATLSIVNDDILQSSNSTLLKIWLRSLEDYDVVIKPDSAGAPWRIAKVLYQWCVGFLGLRTEPSAGNYKYFFFSLTYFLLYSIGNIILN